MGFGRGTGFTPRLIAQDTSHLLVVEQAGQTPEAEETDPTYVDQNVDGASGIATETSATSTSVVT